MWNKSEIPSRMNGFTLLELLMSLSLTSVLLAVLYGSFYQSSFGVNKISKINNEASRFNLIYKHLRLQLQKAVDIPESGHSVFSGDSRSLTFVSALPPLQGHAGLYKYQLSSGIQDSELVVTPYQPQVHHSEMFTLKDSGPLQITYKTDHKAESEWQTQWQDKPHLPALIRIKFTAQDLLPPLTVAIRRGGYES
ncbi:prepilin-type N-terminal cleavage/methylation domain-containing protein [Aliamphritea spongicola]|uniref:prepilin-type N-terminal cleavage/methylation domain-containing protein n=1 Tax=Aliamphritea spongicola TaxID=707589 RepID=UPI00196B6DA1|nr:prepilin-type N-terminal cleavage/methylation domain-containing protein [Aliamphritea spongicola]MBN3561216.1 prepilin-type N-terminal cleavage/methylation domain-containing protein [Aliamphritea spongicola]